MTKFFDRFTFFLLLRFETAAEWNHSCFGWFRRNIYNMGKILKKGSGGGIKKERVMLIIRKYIFLQARLPGCPSACILLQLSNYYYINYMGPCAFSRARHPFHHFTCVALLNRPIVRWRITQESSGGGI